MKRKIIMLFTSISLVCFATTPALASENNQSSKEDIISSETLDDVFNDMKNSVISGEEVSFSVSLEKVGGLHISTEPQYTLSSTTIDWNNLDASLTNLGFNEVSASLANSYNSIDLSGMSTECTELFNNSFGDIANSIEVSNYSMPSGFNKGDMLTKNQKWITGLYEDAIKNDETYNVVKNHIGIGQVFKEASAGPSEEETKTISFLFNSLGGEANLKKLYYDEADYIDKVYETTTLTAEQQSEQKEQARTDLKQEMYNTFLSISKVLTAVMDY